MGKKSIFGIQQGIFFSSAFAGMFWIREQHPGEFNALTAFNSYIMKDENMHTRAGCAYHNALINRCTAARVHAIVSEAVDIECAFMERIIRDDVVGLNRDEMSQYVRFIADILCSMLLDERGQPVPALYGATNPYRWMVSQSLRPKENFFEYHVSEYVKAAPLTTPSRSDSAGNLDMDFNADI